MSVGQTSMSMWYTVLLVFLKSTSFTEQHKNCYQGNSGGSTCHVKKCKWGYETGCSERQWFQTPYCVEEDDYRKFISLEEKIKVFWRETDFGYVREALPSHYICHSDKKSGSSLYCNDKLTYCHGENILFDFRSGDFPFESGEVSKKNLLGGFCKLQNTELIGRNYRETGLISWSRHLRQFKELDFPVDENSCDVVVQRPTFLLELDAIGNMYHHFCDFFNLYITKHVYGSLRKDVDIAFWEKYPRRSYGPFSDTWKLFTENDVFPIGGKYTGKRVCFKNIMFSLLPRMEQGMYYSTPVIAGCSRSGLFRAFSKFITHGFRIKQERRNKTLPIRVTLLLRGTLYRKILNKDELLAVMKEESDVTVREITFGRDIPFRDQLQISHDTDLLIGIHGAGLTHSLFMPNWGTLFELYNTDDIQCYRDLARLRGLSYFTWEKNELIKSTKPQSSHHGDHAKFWNFVFDVKEFRRLYKEALKKTRGSISSYF